MLAVPRLFDVDTAADVVALAVAVVVVVAADDDDDATTNEPLDESRLTPPLGVGALCDSNAPAPPPAAAPPPTAATVDDEVVVALSAFDAVAPSAADNASDGVDALVVVVVVAVVVNACCDGESSASSAASVVADRFVNRSFVPAAVAFADFDVGFGGCKERKKEREKRNIVRERTRLQRSMIDRTSSKNLCRPCRRERRRSRQRIERRPRNDRRRRRRIGHRRRRRDRDGRRRRAQRRHVGSQSDCAVWSGGRATKIARTRSGEHKRMKITQHTASYLPAMIE